MWLSAIISYPVKSLRDQAWAAASLDPRGIIGDRRWMVIDERHRFLTRRELPAMALIAVSETDNGLILSHTIGACRAQVPPADAAVVTATIWRDKVAVRLGNNAADAFLSAALNRPVRLAHQFDASQRAIDPRFAPADAQVSLADGFPLLITTIASLGALNARLAQPITMARFRPNLVIMGAEPWAEDRWRQVRIGGVELRLARPCSRCVIVTQEPGTGQRLHGNEPLTTLRTLGRSVPGGIMFGQNAIPNRLGSLQVGDTVEILAEGDSSVPAGAPD